MKINSLWHPRLEIEDLNSICHYSSLTDFLYEDQNGEGGNLQSCRPRLKKCQ